MTAVPRTVTDRRRATVAAMLETVFRLVGAGLIIIAVGSIDWRLAAVLLGAALILATIELPRRSR